MGKNLLVINVDIRETRVALIENGIIAELHLERESSKGTLGNIYLGKVSRVLPGMQAAFIDVGLERAAFLHVEDLIRPDDFEAYLAGHRRHGEEQRETRRASARPPSEHPEAEEAEEESAAAQPAEEVEAQAEEAEPQAEEAEAQPEEDELPSDVEAQAAAAPERDVPIELPTALDVLGGPSAEAFAGMDGIEPLDGEEEDDDGGEDELEGAGEDDGADEEPAEAADAESEPAEGVDEDIEEPAYDVAPAGELVEEEGAAAAREDRGEGLLEPGDERAAEGSATAPSEVAAPGPAAASESAEEEVPQVPRARTGRTARPRREGRVRRSGHTRDRRAGVGAEEAAPEAPQREGREPARDQRREGREPREGRDQRREGRDQKDQRGRDQRGRDRGRDQGGRDAKGRGGARGAQGARTRQNEPPRISKSTPIREVIREGQEVLVQISKEPIGTKGARVTSHISLPGRYVVYLPTVDHIGISKRIGSEKERSRLRESIEAMKPPQGGLIVRTLAEGLTKKQLKADVGYLVRLWGEVVKKRESGMKAPVVLYTELDLVLKTARDLFTDDIEKIVIDDRDEYIRLKRFVEMFMPERADAVELYEGEEPIFDAYGIEDEIQRALARKVPLPSGGHLIIDQAEALTAIDVNTGRFVGKGSKDLEETILTTNLEAVEEIAYQLRFRNIGGLIILDLIDMERAQNREKVRKRLEELLSRDKAKTTLNRISDLGLIEMTRKRTRESLGRTILEPCFYCDGTGQLQSKQTIAYEILRQIRRERMNLPGYSVVVNAHPAVIDLLKSDERIAVQEAERLFQRRIDLVPRKEYHLEQFDLQGR
ncbi:MAG: Rne/Rng family ribonuclease [Polyangiaceae bacterium]|nr:Rne/Rng family ribonuclease [Polyangiaceae bacterium]